MSVEEIARRGFVSGRVQGVAFRYYARDQAQAFGVAGWVRNLPDGRVEFHCQGRPSLVSAFIEWLHEGPPMARVSDVEVEETATSSIAGFDIRG